MPRWIDKLLESRRAQVTTLSALGVFLVGSCSGVALANFTVGGMSDYYYGRTQILARVQSEPEMPEWQRQATSYAMGDMHRVRDYAAPADEARYQTASY